MIFYVSAATVFILDQVTKLFVVLAITPFSGEGRLTLIPHVLDLVHRTNNGAAFSLFTGHTLILSIISLIAVVFIFFWQRSVPKQETWMRVSMGLIWGGALGNLFDRIFRGGFVVDMIRVHWHEKDLWPVFNLADSFICIGVGLFILLVFIHKKEIGGYEKEE